MTKDEALQLAHEGIEIHSPNDNEYKVCAALIKALETKEGLLDRNSYLLGLYDQKSRLELETKDEPVALETVYETIIHWDEGGGKRSRKELARRIVDLYAITFQIKDEPVAWEQFHEHMAGPNYVAPQRTWVGLTDEEANQLWESTDSDWELMKRTEAKLKDKNGY